jgi:hypothetical protein
VHTNIGKTNNKPQLATYYSTIQSTECDPILPQSCPPSPLPPTKILPPICDPRYGFSTFGCYCGSGDTCKEGFECLPINQLDGLCRQHDIDCGNCTIGTRFEPQCIEIATRADRVLCEGAWNFQPTMLRYNVRVKIIFCYPQIDIEGLDNEAKLAQGHSETEIAQLLHEAQSVEMLNF